MKWFEKGDITIDAMQEIDEEECTKNSMLVDSRMPGHVVIFMREVPRTRFGRCESRSGVWSVIRPLEARDGILTIIIVTPTRISMILSPDEPGERF
jgi:hypothetical protein